MSDVPARLNSDSRPAFTTRPARAWLAQVGARALFIDPGSPWENGYVENFKGELHDELFEREICYTLLEAKASIEYWRTTYNCIRPTARAKIAR